MNIDSLERLLESGAMPLKTQKLVALGIAIALRGDECVTRHVREALEAGATRDDLSDAVKVALTIDGGGALSYVRRLQGAVERIETGEDAPAAPDVRLRN